MTLATRPSSLDQQILSPAVDLAERIAGTDFVPKTLRGRPEAVLAAILTGHELGVGPMVALANIAVIEGRPAMSAHLMRALLARDGIYLHPDDSTATRCVMTGSRNGTDPITVTWTMDDAKRANLAHKDNWRKYPRQMLAARATAELARLLAPDSLGGLYAIEELEDSPGDDAPLELEPAPQTRKRRRRAPTQSTVPSELLNEPKPIEAEIVPHPAQGPPLPGEDDPELVERIMKQALDLTPQSEDLEEPPVAARTTETTAPTADRLEGSAEPGAAATGDLEDPSDQDEQSPVPEIPGQISIADLEGDPDESPADHLTRVLAEPIVQPGTTLIELQERVRILFRLMDQVGYWKASDDPRHDALHQALRRHSAVRHLTDLRKGGLIVFAQIAQDAAWEATKTPPPTDDEQ